MGPEVRRYGRGHSIFGPGKSVGRSVYHLLIARDVEVVFMITTLFSGSTDSQMLTCAESA